MATRYCSNCGHMLEPDARFCSNCGRPVRRPEGEPDAPTSQMPMSPQPAPPQTVPPTAPHPAPQPVQQPAPSVAPGPAPQYQLQERRSGVRVAPMLALAAVILILVVVEIMQGGIGGAITAMIAVAVVVLVGSGVSYLALARRGSGASLGEAVFNWSVVVLAAFAALLFLIS